MGAAIKLSHPATKGFWEISVLYEDDALIALDKPAGLATLPTPGAPGPDILSLLHDAIRDAKPWALERRLTFLRNANTLDAGVSGVLLLAKSQEVLTPLLNLFGSEKPERRYLAIVHGEPQGQTFEVDAKLAPHPEDPCVMRVDSRDGKKSHTRFEVAERFRGWTLLACMPHPDRPHQVRVHLRHARLPVVGDPLYRGGNLWLSRIKPGFRLKPGKEERPLMPRPALHLEKLLLPHPMTGVDLSITAPIPKDLSVALKYLRKYAAA